MKPTAEANTIRFSRSIRGRLTFLFFVLFIAISALGIASMWSLGHSIAVSSEVRDRWLPNVRLLGDINNFTSDARTAEANILLAANAQDMADAEGDLAALTNKIVDTGRDYELIEHNDAEAAMYHDFYAAWSRYRKVATQVVALARTGRFAEATLQYQGASRAAYLEASDLLGHLTSSNVELAAQASEKSAEAYALARLLTGATLAVATVMLLIVILQVRSQISFPLIDLGQVMHRLADNDISVVVGHTDRADEIGEMARAVTVFRANAIELIHSRAGLAQQATMLEEKLAHEQFVAQAQRNFVSMIAHEFRTPLTQIDAQAQRLHSLKDRLDPESLVERTGRIRIAVTRIVRMIDSLVDATRLVDGDPRMFFHPERFDLVPVLQEACRQHREISPSAMVLADFGRLKLDVIGDQKLLGQAFGNLIANAIKYSPENARVVMRAKQVGKKIIVEVEDAGIGIPTEDQASIFTRYFRGSNVGGFVGSGIGLFLVATAVKLHDGEVSMISAPGHGSLFKVVLNAAPHLAATADGRSRF